MIHIDVSDKPFPIENIIRAMPARVPDFEAVRDKRISELTPEQRDDSLELWLREQIDWMPEFHREHYKFLLRRLDAARGVNYE